MEDFIVARNPEPDSTLPFLIRLPLAGAPVVLKTRETWSRTSKVYCHRALEWPDDLEIIERVPVRLCQRRGAAVDLVLDRGREHRSQFVFTTARGREVIFWQSARTTRQARPNVSLPSARASGETLQILVDSHERYPWAFAHQQATTHRRHLTVGDYAVELDDSVVAVIERKSLADLVSTLTGGRLNYVLADLSAAPSAAIVVEDRYAAVFKLDRVRPAVVADGLGEAAVRFPRVPIVFAGTRPLAQEWAYRFFGAAVAHRRESAVATARIAELTLAGPPPPRPATTAEVRAWARRNGIAVADGGRLRPEVWQAFHERGDDRGDQRARR